MTEDNIPELETDELFFINMILLILRLTELPTNGDLDD